MIHFGGRQSPPELLLEELDDELLLELDELEDELEELELLLMAVLVQVSVMVS